MRSETPTSVDIACVGVLALSSVPARGVQTQPHLLIQLHKSMVAARIYLPGFLPPRKHSHPRLHS